MIAAKTAWSRSLMSRSISSRSDRSASAAADISRLRLLRKAFRSWATTRAPQEDRCHRVRTDNGSAWRGRRVPRILSGAGGAVERVRLNCRIPETGDTMYAKEAAMIELNDDQRQAVQRGEPLQVCVDGRDLVLLRTDIYRRIRAILQVERGVIAAGHTRAPVTLPEPLEALPADGLVEVVELPADRFSEIQELVADDRERTAWHGAIANAQESWAKENSYRNDPPR